jgi:hypothetical protein
LHCYFLAHWFLFLSLSVYVFHYFPLSSYFLYLFLPLSLFCFFFSEQLSLYLLFATRNLFLSVLIFFHSVNTFTASFFSYLHSLFHHSFFIPVLFAPLTITSFLSLLFQLHNSFSSTVISSTSCSSDLFLVSSYTLLLLVYPIFLLSPSPLFFLNSFISAWNRQKK